MDFKIDINTRTGIGEMSFDKADTIINNIYLSLMVEKGRFFQNPDFGSRLHLLERAKNTDQTAALAGEYCKDALQWLIDTGRASKIEVYTERDTELNRVGLLAEITQADGNQVSFETFVEVV